MFVDKDLENHLKTKNGIEVKPLVLAEWNMNDLDNIFKYGNYRYRPFDTSSAQFTNRLMFFNQNDNGTFYKNADVSTNLSNTVEEDNGTPIRFTSVDQDRKLYFNLLQCFEPFRPRSGINKSLYISDQYIDNVKSHSRPRYYLASRNDTFKYWNSYRKENEIEYGISDFIDETNAKGFDIDDVCPFVVYNKAVPANRIVVKMQTNLAKSNSEVFIRTRKNNQSILDPLTDRTKSSIPKRWGIEYLDENNRWVTAIEFNEDSLRSDDSQIVDWDGYVEIAYGLKIPKEYRKEFHLVEYISSIITLPISNISYGESYILNSNSASAGVVFTWNGNDWQTYPAEYGFELYEQNDSQKFGIINSLVDPKFFVNNGQTIYRDVVFLKGLRLFVKTMNAPNQTFNLIELSPRLKADITNYAVSYNVTKELSNDANGLPVGALLASNGEVEIFNFDGAFTENNIFENNQGSLIANQLKPNVKFIFYEAVKKVESSNNFLYDKYIPVKTFYAEDFPPSHGGRNLNIFLRDFFFRLETMQAPSMFLPNISLTGAIAMLLDNIGFSNYVFLNELTEYDPKLPFFFVEPDVSVAEVLNRLAVATQTAMFFDEYNNFVVMFKEKLLPTSPTLGYELLGNKKVTSGSVSLPNIIDIASSESKIFNNGNIQYTSRYIQRASGKLQDELFLSEDKSYRYKPVLLWEVSEDNMLRDMNEVMSGTAFALSAVPLAFDLSANIPSVSGGEIINNFIDLGENAYWLSRAKGLLYANGEIIKYDGIEYAVSSSVATNIANVIISSSEEYQNYVAKLPFNGKIYPTGRVRIYAEPYYVEDTTNANSATIRFQEGQVREHGRGQFNTNIVYHNSGLPSYWINNSYIKSFKNSSEKIFITLPVDDITYSGITFQNPPTSIAGQSAALDTAAQSAKRTGVIKNFIRKQNFLDAEDGEYTTQTTKKISGAVQSSALVFTGPNPMPSGFEKRDVVTYIYKDFSETSASTVMTHVGTRMRIIGIPKEENKQSIKNSTTYFNVQVNNNDQVTNIDGGSGGIGICVNSEKNYGYFLEICSLTQNNLEQFKKYDESTGKLIYTIENVILYKMVPDTNGNAIPVKLWGSLQPILIDEGKFVGTDRATNIENPTVYDIALEYVDNGNAKTFYVWLNDMNIATVVDNGQKSAPVLPATNKACLFVRGSSQCMFEYFYGINNVYAKQSRFPLIENVSKVFGKEEIDSQALKQYAVSGILKSTYLSGISSQTNPKFNLYFEEFGTIMREAKYFNIRYDQAYPALLSYLAPTINKERGYTVSGFYGGSYGAEFLIFNSTDRTIVLDDTSGNFLRILGVTFTQNTTRELTVDEFLNENTDFTDKTEFRSSVLSSPNIAQKIFNTVKNSRFKYGNRDFTIESPYIQSADMAENLMSWLISKIVRQRKTVILKTFGTQLLQLGDIVNIDYTMTDGKKFVDSDKKFVVSGINYSRSFDKIETNIKVVEI